MSGVTGLRDVGAKAPVDTNSVFRIASMTKSFTAMAIMRLRDEGKLSLDDPAERYVPELKKLKYPTTDSPKITIRHLLSHSAGFPEDNPWGDQQLARTDAELSAMLKKGIPFSNPPGVAYEYSNYGFAILGRIVTRASGKPYNEYIATHILRPLDMRSTTLSPALGAGGAPGARVPVGGRAVEGRAPAPRRLVRRHGRHAHVAERPGPLCRRLPRRVAAAGWAGDRPGAPGVAARDAAGLAAIPADRGAGFRGVRINTGGYGFGLRVGADCDFGHVVSHSGGLPGFGSRMQWLPEYGIGIIAFGNRTYTGWGPPVAAALAVLKQRGGLMTRQALPSQALVEARERVTRLILNWDDDLARSIAAENLFLDRSLDRRRADVTELGEAGGAVRRGEGRVFVWRTRCGGSGRWGAPERPDGGDAGADDAAVGAVSGCGTSVDGIGDES